MNRPQFLPYTAYMIPPYPPQLGPGVPGYNNGPPMTPPPGAGPATTQLAYLYPTYTQQFHVQQAPAHQSAWPSSSSTSSTTPGGGGGYAPVAGQIEDIVSPPNPMMNNSRNGGTTPFPLPPGKHHTTNRQNLPGRGRSHIPHGIHPSSLPQVQDVFAPRQPQPQPSTGSPFEAVGMPVPMSVPAAASRMVGAYPPMPTQQTQTQQQQQHEQQNMPSSSAISTSSPVHSQGSPPNVGMSRRLVGARQRTVGSDGFPTPPTESDTMGIGMGRIAGMGMVQPVGGGPAAGYGRFNPSH